MSKPKIFYGVAGEGRGHAARALALIEALRPRFDMIIYANGQAYEMLAPVYLGSDVQVYRTPDVAFRYGHGQRLSYVRTGLANTHYIWTLPRLVAQVRAHMERAEPVLVLSDFEPVLPRAAVQAGIPYLSITHQHFLLACDLSELSARHRSYVAFMAPFVAWWYQGQSETIVSSFFDAPIKKSWSDRARHIGVLIRPEIQEASPEDRGHVLAYVRRAGTEASLDALRDCGRPVKLYGLGERPRMGDVTFHAIDPFRFVEDLATCTGLVTTAGNQLVGEALYLGKPVLAMPEVGNFEQEINGYYLEKSGAGVSHPIDRVHSMDVRRFLDRIPAYAENIDHAHVDGLPAALARIDAWVERRMPRAAVPATPSLGAHEPERING